MPSSTIQQVLPLQPIYGYMQDGKVYNQGYEGTSQVGVSLAVYNDLQKQYEELTKVTETYKTRLVELGEIEVPLTQEQIIEKQAEQLRQSQALMEKLMAKVDLLTKEKGNEPTGNNSVDCGRQSKAVANDAGSLSSGAGNPEKPCGHPGVSQRQQCPYSGYASVPESGNNGADNIG